MKENEIRMQVHCASCGAAVTTAICPYCGSLTGLTEEDSYNEYPVLECKSAKLTFFNTVFPLIFTLSFGLAGGILLAVGLFGEQFPLLMSLPFLLIGIGAGIFFIRSLYRYFLVKTRGEVMEARVYGYTEDNYTINGIHALRVKLLVTAEGGPHYIYYSTGKTQKEYVINSTIQLISYKNYFLILS